MVLSWWLIIIMCLINSLLCDEKTLCEQAWFKSDAYKQATDILDVYAMNDYQKRFMHICYQYCKFESGLPRLQTSTSDMGIVYQSFKQQIRNQYVTDKYPEILLQNDSWSKKEQQLFKTNPQKIIESKINALFEPYWELKLTTESQNDKCWIFEIVAELYVINSTLSILKTQTNNRSIGTLFEVELFPLFLGSYTEILTEEYQSYIPGDSRGKKTLQYLETLNTAINEKYDQWIQPWVDNLRDLYVNLYFNHPEIKVLNSEKKKLKKLLIIFEHEMIPMIPKFVFRKYDSYLQRAMNRFEYNFQKWMLDYDNHKSKIKMLINN